MAKANRKFSLNLSSSAVMPRSAVCLVLNRLVTTAGGPVQLLKGVDPNKDQSYFLASVPAQALQHFLFPLGGMLKPDVRALAVDAGLSSASRRSSAGVCFIGVLPISSA